MYLFTVDYNNGMTVYCLYLMIFGWGLGFNLKSPISTTIGISLSLFPLRFTTDIGIASMQVGYLFNEETEEAM